MLFIPITAATTTLTYIETRGTTITQNQWTIIPTQSHYLHISGYNSIEHAEFLIVNNNTYSWHEQRLDQDTTFTMTRTSDNIRLIGRIDGQLIQKDYPMMPDIHWIQAVGVSLAPFILSDHQKLVFKLFSIKEQQFLDMQVVKKEIAQIPCGPQPCDAIKVFFTPTGWKAAFWRAILWFSTDTGYIIQYDGLAGGLGSDPLLINFVEKY